MPQVAENMKAWEGSFHDGTSVSPKLALPLLIPSLQENGPNLPFLSGGPMSITSLKVWSIATLRFASQTRDACSMSCRVIHSGYTLVLY